jgi:hypothetical protein
MDLKEIVKLQMVEIDKLRVENQRLLNWIMGDEPDALTYLQRVYSDPSASEARRDKTAIGALPFERAKPTSVSVVIDFKAKVRNARLRALERDKARWAAEDVAKLTIEHQPPTILGEDGPDPAA